MGNRLYVGNLSFDTTDADLIAAFEQGGVKVTSAQIMMDRDTGRSRGFAFVEVAAADLQTAIKAMDGAQLDGRALRVNEAEERKSRPGGGGGGGGYGGRGGGGGYGGGGGGGKRDRY
jgi:RNA recognition motif-containing protein